MKKLTWFTHTNISSRTPKSYSSFLASKEIADITFDLSEFLNIFISNEIWTKKRYRSEYSSDFTKEDVDKIKLVKIHIHCKGGPFSNSHEYEKVLKSYCMSVNTNNSI